MFLQRLRRSKRLDLLLMLSKCGQKLALINENKRSNLVNFERSLKIKTIKTQITLIKKLKKQFLCIFCQQLRVTNRMLHNLKGKESHK
jgi:hypothetical protein